MGTTRFAEAVIRVGPWVIAVGAVAAVLAGLILHAQASSQLEDAHELYLADVWVAVITPVAGALLLTWRITPLLGMALLSTALLGAGILTGNFATHAVAAGSEPRLAIDAAAWLATWTWSPYLVLLLVVPILVPDGKPASRRWGWVATALLAAIVTLAVASAVVPGPVEAYPHLENPLGWAEAGALDAVGPIAVAGTVAVGAPVALTAVVVRWWQGRRDATLRIGWFLVSVVVLVGCVLTADLFPYPWIDIGPALGFTLVIAGLLAAVATSRQAAERQRSSRELAEARMALSDRFRRDLHDGVGPELAGLTLQVHSIASTMDGHPAAAQLTAVEASLRRATREVRDLIDGGNEADAFDLLPLLDHRARTLSEATSTVFTIEAVACPPAFPVRIGMAAYRIASEAMTNTARHAQARICEVRLRSDGRSLILDIEDDGRGAGPDSRRGVGSDSMRQRALDVGGAFSTGPGQGGAGLRVNAVLPLEES